MGLARIPLRPLVERWALCGRGSGVSRNSTRGIHNSSSFQAIQGTHSSGIIGSQAKIWCQLQQTVPRSCQRRSRSFRASEIVSKISQKDSSSFWANELHIFQDCQAYISSCIITNLCLWNWNHDSLRPLERIQTGETRIYEATIPSRPIDTEAELSTHHSPTMDRYEGVFSLSDHHFRIHTLYISIWFVQVSKRFLQQICHFGNDGSFQQEIIMSKLLDNIRLR